MWTSLSIESYLAVTCHYINNDFKLETLTLQAARFPESHTAENIATELERIISDWGLKDKVLCVAADSAANVKSASDRIPCFAHTINLIVKRGLNHVSDLRGKCRKIVGYFKSSTTGKEKRTSMQLTLGKPIQKLTQEVDTMWNSTYAMFSRLVEQKECVSATLAAIESAPENITPLEWSIVQNLLPILEPFNMMTEEVPSDRHVSLSKVICFNRQINTLKDETISEQRHKCRSATSIGRTCDGAGSKVYKRGKCLLHAFAAILDPRFKTLPFLSSGKRDEAVNLLINEACKAWSTN
jgi:hypothetical protein